MNERVKYLYVDILKNNLPIRNSSIDFLAGNYPDIIQLSIEDRLYKCLLPNTERYNWAWQKYL